MGAVWTKDREGQARCPMALSVSLAMCSQSSKAGMDMVAFAGIGLVGERQAETVARMVAEAFGPFSASARVGQARRSGRRVSCSVHLIGILCWGARRWDRASGHSEIRRRFWRRPGLASALPGSLIFGSLTAGFEPMGFATGPLPEWMKCDGAALDEALARFEQEALGGAAADPCAAKGPRL